MALGWGIIGIGDIAERGMGPALNRASHTKLVAVFSRCMDRAKQFAIKHKAERAYDSLNKMLEDPELDIVYIATPNSLHAHQTVIAAEAGKHVLCEKPMALTIHDCELMIQACNKNKVKLGVNFQNRYHSAHFEARRYTQSGALGEIYLAKAQLCRGFARGSWRGWRADPNMAGSGAIVGQGVHPVDLLRFLLDSEIQEVHAMTDESPPQRPVDEMVYSMLKFKNGVHGIVVAGTLMPRYDNDVILYGSKAKITCKGTLGVPIQDRPGEIIVESDSFNMKTVFPHDNPLQIKMVRVVEDFNKSVQENSEPLLSGYNGLQMVKIANAILESSRKGKAIEIK
jgi:predicted dehydrogenase